MNIADRRIIWIGPEHAKIPIRVTPMGHDTHFTGAEVSGGRYPALVDAEFLERLDSFRCAIDVPIHVNSWYRDPAHNAAVGGASDSAHMYGLAADIRFTPPLVGLMGQHHVTDMMARAAYANGFRRIGIAASYIHVDIAPGEAYWVYVARNHTSPAPADLVAFIKEGGA